MNRRDFNRGLSITAAASATAAMGLAAWPLGASAQAAPVEGRDFVRLGKPLPVAPGPVEVVEFFGYWCPHCYAFEPSLHDWAQKLDPAKVKLRRVSVSFRGALDENIQRMFFALETLGKVDELHTKVFDAIHRTKQLAPYPNETQIATFLKAQGADADAVLSAMKGFAVATKVRQARQLAEGYQIDSVPTLGVQGRWRTSPSMARSQRGALQVVDGLVAQVAKG